MFKLFKSVKPLLTRQPARAAPSGLTDSGIKSSFIWIRPSPAFSPQPIVNGSLFRMHFSPTTTLLCALLIGSHLCPTLLNIAPVVAALKSPYVFKMSLSIYSSSLTPLNLQKFVIPLSITPFVLQDPSGMGFLPSVNIQKCLWRRFHTYRLRDYCEEVKCKQFMTRAVA